jgi:branched-chain amino acid transport system permease protein
VRRRYLSWGVYAALLLAAPLAFRSGFALSILCQMGIVIVFALSYNMLLGQTGLLSFGHAVYYGLGALFTIHALNLMHGKVPVALMPLVGGIAGLVFGIVFGYVTTRRAGTTFAMISLGVGEMVAACSLMFPGFFGGEAGISGNRGFGSQVAMYYLIAAWVLACSVAIYALSRTPLGRMANAVRDNPERAQFVGYDPQHVRFMMVALSGFFAGIAGGLAALNYEIVSAESLSAQTSGMVLLATYLGGIQFFAGPIAGALVVTLMQSALGLVTEAWPFYFGAMFLAAVLYMPGGITGVVLWHKRLWNAGLIGRAAPVYAAMAVPTIVAFCGAAALVEMAYRQTKALELWIGAVVVLMAGWLASRWVWRKCHARWSEIKERVA